MSGIGGNGGPDDNAAQGGHLLGFDLAQITSGENGSNPRPGDPRPPLAATGKPHVATLGPDVWQQHGSNLGSVGTLRKGNGNVTAGVPFTTHALTSEGADASEDGTGRGTPIVAFGHTNGLDHQASEEVTPTLRSGRTSAAGQAVMDASVRRLTPVECERLQGFPDGWTAVSNGRPESDAGRYRKLGNSVAVPVFEWVARRWRAVASTNGASR